MGYSVGDQYINDNDPGGYVVNGVYIPKKRKKRKKEQK